MFLALSLLACLLPNQPIAAPVVRAVEISVDIDQKSQYALELRSIAWTDDGLKWKLRFEYVRSGENPGPLRRISIVGPGGVSQEVHLVDFVDDTVNGAMLEVTPGTRQTLPLGIKRTFDHPFCLVWETPTWRIYRVLWLIGGVSGPPPVPMVVVAQDRASGRWTAWGTAIDTHAADVQGIDALEGDRVQVWWWELVSLETMRRRSWIVERRDGEPYFSDGPVPYMFWTWNGSPRTFGATPQEARQLGRLEVAWRVETTTPTGGVAIARGESPRHFDGSEWLHDGLLVPHSGDRHEFHWQAQVSVVPARGRIRWVSRQEARALAAKGGWDVVLYRRGHEVRGEWLVESR